MMSSATSTPPPPSSRILVWTFHLGIKISMKRKQVAIEGREGCLSVRIKQTPLIEGQISYLTSNNDQPCCESSPVFQRVTPAISYQVRFFGLLLITTDHCPGEGLQCIAFHLNNDHITTFHLSRLKYFQPNNGIFTYKSQPLWPY